MSEKTGIEKKKNIENSTGIPGRLVHTLGTMGKKDSSLKKT